MSGESQHRKGRDGEGLRGVRTALGWKAEYLVKAA